MLMYIFCFSQLLSCHAFAFSFFTDGLETVSGKPITMISFVLSLYLITNDGYIFKISQTQGPLMHKK